MRKFMRALCAIAILVQIPQAADMFAMTYPQSHLDPSLRMAHAYLYATVFELSLLVFVLQGRQLTGIVFAVISVLTNLIVHGVWAPLTAAAPVLVSIQLPLAIGIYSHEIYRDRRRLEREDAERRAEAERRQQLANQAEERRRRSLEASANRHSPVRPAVAESQGGVALAAPLHPGGSAHARHASNGAASLLTAPDPAAEHASGSILPAEDSLPPVVRSEGVGLAEAVAGDLPGGDGADGQGSQSDGGAEVPGGLPKQDCDVCKKPFRPGRPGARFCSAACRNRDYRARRTVATVLPDKALAGQEN